MWRAYKAAGTTIRLQIIGQKILAHLSPEAGDLLSIGHDDEEPCHRSKKQRPRTKEHAYIRRYYHLSRPYKERYPEGIDVPLINMGSPKPISKGHGERHAVTVVARLC